MGAREHRPSDSTENRVGGGRISFWRAWTVNYGRYCPPANNRPPHYMWELLTADRLGGSLSAPRSEPSSNLHLATRSPRLLLLSRFSSLLSACFRLRYTGTRAHAPCFRSLFFFLSLSLKLREERGAFRAS